MTPNTIELLAFDNELIQKKVATIEDNFASVSGSESCLILIGEYNDVKEKFVLQRKEGTFLELDRGHDLINNLTIGLETE